eukprot:s2453_g15.t1
MESGRLKVGSNAGSTQRSTDTEFQCQASEVECLTCESIGASTRHFDLGLQVLKFVSVSHLFSSTWVILGFEKAPLPFAVKRMAEDSSMMEGLEGREANSYLAHGRSRFLQTMKCFSFLMLSVVIWGFFLSNGHFFSISHAPLRSLEKMTTVRKLTEPILPKGDFSDLGLGTTCRIKKPQREDEDPGALWQIEPQNKEEGRLIQKITLKKCKEECLTEEATNKRHCYAIEYRSSERRCEIWTQPIVNVVDTFTDQTVEEKPGKPVYDFHCYLAMTSRATCGELVVAHKRLGDALIKYQEECPSLTKDKIIHDKFQKCRTVHLLNLLLSLQRTRTGT